MYVAVHVSRTSNMNNCINTAPTYLLADMMLQLPGPPGPPGPMVSSILN